jgi:flagellar biogenesis protein FliO
MKTLLSELNFGMILALIIALAGILILIYSFLKMIFSKK